MELKKEWVSRIEAWMRCLSRDIFHKIDSIPMQGVAVTEHISLSEAKNKDLIPYNHGDKWGKEWEYLWLFGKVKVPEEYRGQRISLSIEAGGESAVYVNGEEFGCRRDNWVRDEIHRLSDLTLVKSALGGEEFDIALEVYAGHDSPGTSVGPVMGEHFGFKHNPDGSRTSFNEVAFGYWNELAYQLYLDVKFLFRLVRSMKDDSLRYWEIYDALKDFTTIVDFEQNEEQRNKCYIKARKRLAPIFNEKNGDVAPEFLAFGNAHIDVAWLWPLAETERKVLRTFAAQIRHMDEYPDYKFLQSQPHLYRMVKEFYPQLFERIREKVANGQWIAEGAMWVEPDMNIASGEALIRQIIHGKRFYKDEFGVDSKVLWLPDVFGYNAALPQILKGCGVDYFCTQKIWWAYNGGEQFPYNYFDWVGIDGTSVPTFLHVNYTSDTEADVLLDRWNNRRQRYGIKGFMLPYGYGDGGGGPCRDFIENIHRAEDFQGLAKCRHDGPVEFFEWHGEPKEKYVGELYLQCHRGVQTSQAKTKKNNRKCELSLRETEFWGVVAKTKGGYFPLDVVDELWKKVLLCQFHDILPGSSIHRVYEEAEKMYSEVLATSEGIRGTCKAVLTDVSRDLCVFNSLSFDRKVLLELPYGYNGAKIGETELPTQCIGNRLYAEVTVPQCSYLTVSDSLPYESGKTNVFAEAGENYALLENDLIRVLFNEKGAITSIFDKTAKRELARGLCNEMKMYKDIPNRYDAWDIDLSYEQNPVELNENASFELVATGELIGAIRITRKIGKSLLMQTVSLRNDTKRVDFETTVDWQEMHKMLKVAFDVDYINDEAINEIQFGYVKRPTHRSKQFDHDRFEVANHKYTALTEDSSGFAVLNDCKYGVNVLDTSINLTLLRSPIAPDETCDLGTQTFTYAFYPFEGTISEGGVVREAYDLNIPAETVTGNGEGQIMSLSNNAVVLEALKPAEDGTGDYIIRLYEACGGKARAEVTLNLPFSKISLCDMLENEGEEINAEGNKFTLDFSKFEIKTLRVKP